MGRSGRHRQTETPKRLRTALIAAAGLAVVALAAITVAVTGARSSSAQPKARAAADPPRPLDRASRDQDRTPIATPTPEPSDTPTATPVAKKKRHAKVLAHGACEASYYGTGGGRTASGEAIDPDALTAAHKSLPIGAKVRVTNRNNDRSVVVRINDRGPFVAGRCLDLSSAAMQAVGGLASGVIPVKYEVLAKV
ncbi:septal ring lytic transglycosylase RlpA family protein [Actinoallomurus sp. CA-142502]|uniref:septal ring lytic transglycosylase RlpA family protein n=1 Tax=Actinoallomurus sp. CA-142502 TaxID=3239885 RepID=UPI003D9234D6